MSSIETYGYVVPTMCNDFQFDVVANPVKGVNSEDFATEHVLEFQLITQFFDDTATTMGGLYNDPRPDANGAYTGKTIPWCTYLKPYFYEIANAQRPTCDQVVRTPLDCITWQFPGSDSLYNAEFVLLDKWVNTAKEGVSLLSHIIDTTTDRTDEISSRCGETMLSIPMTR